MPWKIGEHALFLQTRFLFINLEEIRSHDDDVVLFVGIGGLGITVKI